MARPVGSVVERRIVGCVLPLTEIDALRRILRGVLPFALGFAAAPWIDGRTKWVPHLLAERDWFLFLAAGKRPRRRVEPPCGANGDIRRITSAGGLAPQGPEIPRGLSVPGRHDSRSRAELIRESPGQMFGAWSGLLRDCAVSTADTPFSTRDNKLRCRILRARHGCSKCPGQFVEFSGADDWSIADRSARVYDTRRTHRR